MVAFRPNYSNRTFFRSIDRAVQALRRELDALNYDPTISREICQSAHAEHDLVEAIGLGMIDQEDIDRLTEAFIAGFDEVPLHSGAWDVVNDRWEVSIPSPEESRLYAELSGDFDADDAPTLVPPDFEQPAESWLEIAMWNALTDASDPLPFEEQELSEVGILIRR